MSKHSKPRHQPKEHAAPTVNANRTVSSGNGAQPKTPEHADGSHDGTSVSVVWKWVNRAALLAGIGYAVVTFFMWRDAHKGFVNDQRAWVGVSGSGDFNLRLAKGEPLAISLAARNSGKSPALELVSVNKMMTVGPNGTEPDFSGYSKSEAGPPVVLFPNSLTTISVNTAKPSDKGLSLPNLDENQVKGFTDGTIKIYVYGSIWYRDTIQKSEHRTDYCFAYDPQSSAPNNPSFAACKIHNYAD